MKTNKPKLFLYGLCNLYDIASTKLLRSNYEIVDGYWRGDLFINRNLDMSCQSYPGTCAKHLTWNYEAGEIALRVHETLSNDMSWLGKWDCFAIYKEIMKFPYLDFFRKHATQDDFLVISFGPEMLSSCRIGKEVFTCAPAMFYTQYPEHPLHWLWKEYLSKEQYIQPFDVTESMDESRIAAQALAPQLYDIFKDNMIVHRTTFTDRARYRSGIQKFESFADTNLPFYRRTKVITEQRDIEYISKAFAIIERKFIREYPSAAVIHETTKQLYADGDHKWGVSQMHLDLESRVHIATLIHEAIQTKIYENKKNKKSG